MMHADYLGKMKQKVVSVLQNTLHEVLSNVKEQQSCHPSESLDVIIEKVLPSNEKLESMIDTYFRKDSVSKLELPIRYRKVRKPKPRADISCPPPPKKTVQSPIPVPPSSKYIEIQVNDSPLCKFSTYENKFQGEMYIHPENNWIFLEKQSHFICVGIFDTTKNQIDWFPQEE